MPARLPQWQQNEIQRLFADTAHSNQYIAELMNIARRSIDKHRNNYLLFGHIYLDKTLNGGAGRPRSLLPIFEERIFEYLADKPTAYQDEIAWYLYDEFGVVVSQSTISRCLKRHKWSKKVACRLAKERNKEVRDWFEREQEMMPMSRVCCVDESASNERTGWRKTGWTPIGAPCFEEGSCKREVRWSVLPAITQAGYLPGTLVFQGSITAEIFEAWLEHTVLPQLERGSFLVMDNASIHRSETVARLCAEAGVYLQYLPPYSPDFNPIELSFGVLKAWIGLSATSRASIEIATATAQELGVCYHKALDEVAVERVWLVSKMAQQCCYDAWSLPPCEANNTWDWRRRGYINDTIIFMRLGQNIAIPRFYACLL